MVLLSEKLTFMLPLQKLQSLGLTDKEAALYMKALELQTFSVPGIARASGLKRPTAYLVLDELERKGFVSLVPQSKKRLYHVEPPSVLIRHAEHNMSLARTLERDLEHLTTKAPEQVPTVRFYSGQKGIRNIYEDMLRYTGNNYVYIGSMKAFIATVGEEYLSEWLHRRVAKGIHVRAIRIDSEEVIGGDPIFTAQKEALRETRYAPPQVHFKDAIMIYGKKVAITSDEKSTFGFVVENQEFAKSMMSLFDLLWQLSTKTKPIQH